MKKSTFGIVATVVLAFSPLAAFAQDAQTSVQSNTNSAAAVGDANLILQNAAQNGSQTQVGVDAYGYPTTPNSQLSVQDNANEAAAIGNYNAIGQNAAQNSTQNQVDVNQYLPH